MDAYAKERRTRDQNKWKEKRGGGGEERNGATEQHLWVSLLIRYLQEVDGVSQGRLLQRQGEDQGELLGDAMRENLTGRRKSRHSRSLRLLLRNSPVGRTSVRLTPPLSLIYIREDVAYHQDAGLIKTVEDTFMSMPCSSMFLIPARFCFFATFPSPC